MVNIAVLCEYSSLRHCFSYRVLTLTREIKRVISFNQESCPFIHSFIHYITIQYIILTKSAYSRRGKTRALLIEVRLGTVSFIY